ncbi:hypothetical protein D9M71_603070 [compost metagenome]
MYLAISSLRAARRITRSCSAAERLRCSRNHARAGAAPSQVSRMTVNCWPRLVLRSCTSLERNSCRPRLRPPSHWEMSKRWVKTGKASMPASAALISSIAIRVSRAWSTAARSVRFSFASAFSTWPAWSTGRSKALPVAPAERASDAIRLAQIARAAASPAALSMPSR